MHQYTCLHLPDMQLFATCEKVKRNKRKRKVSFVRKKKNIQKKKN